MMKNIAKNAIPKILSLAVLLLIMSGCLRDKLTECSPIEPNNNVKIDFTLFGGGVFTDDVTSVIAVLFDDEGTYIPPAITINKDSLEQYAGMEMALDPGDYRMVFWANIGENTEVKVVDDIPIIIYKNADRTSRRVVGNGDPVWYAPAVESVRVSEIPQPLEYHSFTVPVEGEYTDEVAFAKTHSLVDIYRVAARNRIYAARGNN